jgi:hypothetical protein
LIDGDDDQNAGGDAAFACGALQQTNAIPPPIGGVDASQSETGFDGHHGSDRPAARLYRE